MPFVLDASIVHAWAFDEQQPLADRVRGRMRSDPVIVPSIWWYEVRNGLIMGERRRRLTENQTDAFLRRVARFRVTIGDLPGELSSLSLADTD